MIMAFTSLLLPQYYTYIMPDDAMYHYTCMVKLSIKYYGSTGLHSPKLKKLYPNTLRSIRVHLSPGSPYVNCLYKYHVLSLRHTFLMGIQLTFYW